MKSVRMPLMSCKHLDNLLQSTSEPSLSCIVSCPFPLAWVKSMLLMMRQTPRGSAHHLYIATTGSVLCMLGSWDTVKYKVTCAKSDDEVTTWITVMCQRKLTSEMGSLFHSVLTLYRGGHIDGHIWRLSYCTFGIGVVIRHDLRALLGDSPRK